MEKRCKADRVIDLRGVSCPWSILKAKSQLTLLEPGEVLKVLVTDPKMLVDLPRVLGQKGHQLMEIQKRSGFSQLYVRRGRNEKGIETRTSENHRNATQGQGENNVSTES